MPEPKSQNDRVSECLAILKKITGDLGIDKQNPSILLLKKRMVTYWRDGKIQEDRIPLVGTNRYIIYKFPAWSNQIVEITLRASLMKKVFHKALPAEMQAELDAVASAPSPAPEPKTTE